jgi:hypothetical protein
VWSNAYRVFRCAFCRLRRLYGEFGLMKPTGIHSFKSNGCSRPCDKKMAIGTQRARSLNSAPDGAKLENLHGATMPLEIFDMFRAKTANALYCAGAPIRGTDAAMFVMDAGRDTRRATCMAYMPWSNGCEDEAFRAFRRSVRVGIKHADVPL